MLVILRCIDVHKFTSLFLVKNIVNFARHFAGSGRESAPPALDVSALPPTKVYQQQQNLRVQASEISRHSVVEGFIHSIYKYNWRSYKIAG